MLKPIDSGIELLRIGPSGDGGYLIPNDLDNIEALFSPGVGNIYNFEKEIASRGIKVFMADASVIIDSKIDNIKFENKFVGLDIEENFISFENWVSNSDISIDKDLMLQMDIEGAEYINIISIPPKLLERFRIMVIEFHDLQSLLRYHGFNLISQAFYKILKSHYVVHIHPNNNNYIVKYKGLEIPNLLEFTFLRKDRLKTIKPIIKLPHPLDFDNIPELKTINLPKLWY